MPLNQAHEKLDAAIQTLVTSPGEIKNRLYGAWQCMCTLSTHDHSLTQSIRDQFSNIEKSLIFTSECGEGEISQATINKMTNNEASKIAEDIFLLYKEVANLLQRRQLILG